MKFEISKLGNRICIKTVKRTYNKVSYVKENKAKEIIKKLNKNNFEIIYKDDTIKLIL